MPEYFTVGILYGRGETDIKLNGSNSHNQQINFELDLNVERALSSVLVVRPIFPQDGAAYTGGPDGLITYPFPYATPWRGWQKPGTQRTSTPDGDYQLSTNRKSDGTLSFTSARTARQEMNASSHVSLTMRGDVADPAAWNLLTVHVVIDTDLPATKFVADLTLSRYQG